MKIYVTKYWMTKGIQVYEAELLDTPSGKMVKATSGKRVYPLFFNGPDWHPDARTATAYIESDRKKRIESLRRQIEKLENFKSVLITDE